MNLIVSGKAALAAWGFIALATPVALQADGAVYAMTNALGNNQIKVWSRASDGTLSPLQTIATLGGGSGTQLDATDSLGSQGGMMLDESHRHLFVVNTNSGSVDPVGGDGVHDCHPGSISSFLVEHNGRLTFADQVPSGGLYPDSLTVKGNSLFVLNSGGPGVAPACAVGPNITGFRVGQNGRLSAIAGSTRAIDPGTSPGSFLNCDPGGFPTSQFSCGQNPPAFPRSPGQVGFTPEGHSLVVSVKSTNSIYVFATNEDQDGNVGGLGAPVIWKATGANQPTYFGFSFDSKGDLIISEPFGATASIPAAPKSAVSSFRISERGVLTPISQSVQNGQGTSCWVAVDPRARYAYTANNATNNISSYTIGDHGELTLLAGVAATTPGSHPNDLAVTKDSDKSFLYALQAGTGAVGAWKIGLDGSLTLIGTFSGMPAEAGAQGLAAY